MKFAMALMLLTGNLALATAEKPVEKQEQQSEEKVQKNKTDKSDEEILTPPKHPLAKDRYKLKKDSVGKGMFD